MTDEIKEKRDYWMKKIKADKELSKSRRMRFLVGKYPALTKEKFTPEEYEKILEKVMEDETKRQHILKEFEEHGVLTIKNIASSLGLTTSETLHHLIALRRW